MIARGYDGWRPAGLLAYLFGPGRYEEHQNPRVVAAYNGAPGGLQPPKTGPGEFDLDLSALITLMQHGVRQAGMPLDNPPAITTEWIDHLRSGKPLPSDAPEWLRHYRYDAKKDIVTLREGYVWHTPVRLAPQDPTLTDDQWRHVAQKIMSRVGIHEAGCRWLAVRHADDHIHLMAVLVHQSKNGRWKRYNPRFWKLKLREACQELEAELGLTLTAGCDWTASVMPGKAELEKSARADREPPRLQLRRVVSQTASTVRTREEFARDLAQAGIRVRWKTAADGAAVGYAVALPGDVTAAGDPVWFSGGELAADLTLPKLQARWATAPAPQPVDRTDDGRVSPNGRQEVLVEAEQIVSRAASQLRAGTADGDSVAHSTSEVLAALARACDRASLGVITDASDAFDRAARTPRTVVPNEMSHVSFELRQAARRLGRVGALSGRGLEEVARSMLILALASLVAEIAAWQHDRGRMHQAAAARRAAAALPPAARRRADRRPPARPGADGGRRPVDVSRPRLSADPGPRPRGRGPG